MINWHYFCNGSKTEITKSTSETSIFYNEFGEYFANSLNNSEKLPEAVFGFGVTITGIFTGGTFGTAIAALGVVLSGKSVADLIFQHNVHYYAGDTMTYTQIATHTYYEVNNIFGRDVRYLNVQVINGFSHTRGYGYTKDDYEYSTKL